MPKVVVYIRAEDARTIEAVENKDIDLWVREQIKSQIDAWHRLRAKDLGATQYEGWPMPREPH